MLIHWIIGKAKKRKEISLGTLVIFTSFVGGYLAADYPKEFLNLFTTPLGQLVALLAINWMAYENTKDDPNNEITRTEVVAEAVIGMVILQSVKYILRYIYQKD